MSNGILNKRNQSLEITLRDSLDGLEDFTLMMAYASTRSSFEIQSVKCQQTTPTVSDTPRPRQSATLNLVETKQYAEQDRQQKRA